MSVRCSCPDPRSCTCRGPPNPSHYPNMYQLPSSATSPFVYAPYSPSPGYPHPSHRVSSLPARICSQLPRISTTSPLTARAYRVALADTTSTFVNWTAPQPSQTQSQSSTAHKRKQTQAGSNRMSKHENIGSAVTSTPTSTPTQLFLSQGPILPSPSNALSPSVTCTTGSSSSHGSLLRSTSSINNARVTDVWYFVCGLKDWNAHQTPSFTTTYI